MIKLSEVPFKELKIGDPVRSISTGRLGTITNLINIEFATRKEDNEIQITWEGRKDIPKYWQFCCDSIEYKPL